MVKEDLICEIAKPAYMREIDVIKYYEKTLLGRTLALAKAVSTISREMVESIVNDFMARVGTVNASDEFLYKISKVVIFGSYLDVDAVEYDQLDMAVELTPLYPEGTQNEKEAGFIDSAIKEGKNFDDMIAEMFYPQTCVRSFLKNRCPYISMHAMDDPVVAMANCKQLFPSH